jgi:sterol desaturase/sphingolipid hydroxylase (fatty acid hydroxylase superfamily)
MIINQDSLYNFLFINTVLWTGGTLDYLMLERSFYLLCLICWKNIFLVSLISLKNAKKAYLYPGHRPFDVTEGCWPLAKGRLSADQLKGEIGYLAQITLIDFVSLRLLLWKAYSLESIGWELITFIPRSFFFELIFDLAHYTTHRLAHSIPIVYKAIHKEHHQNILITPFTTFHQNPVDLLLTNTLPLLFASQIVPTSHLFICVMMWYKTLLEVGGHLGKVTKANSFPQCIWLPRLLKIELKSEDHNLHHRNPMRNFSKRFSIWDKAFGTFEAYKEE